ncbi:MAG: type II secretion system protein, partial [Vicinamibacterales bacterium]
AAQYEGRGFTLIEVTIAVALLAVGGAGLASLALASGRANQVARQADVAQRAAVERLEQLRALAWTSDAAVVPVSDWSSNLTLAMPAGTGGPGLGASPGDTLAANVEGYVDFLDAEGRWLGGGTTTPAGAAWVRRWAVQAMSAPQDTLLLQVAVVPAGTTSAATTVASARAVNGAWLMDMRTRRAR